MEEKARRSEQSKQGGAEQGRWRSSCGKQARGKARCTTGGGEVRMNADPVVNSIQIYIYNMRGQDCRDKTGRYQNGLKANC